MAPEPSKPPFKRSWLNFSPSHRQLALFLPTILVLAVLATLVAFSVGRVQSRALEALATQGASSDVTRDFLQQTHSFSLLLTLVTAGVAVVAGVWIWWLAVWIFGPYRRLERELNEVLYGRMDPENLRVRKSDALFPLIERFRAILSKKK